MAAILDPDGDPLLDPDGDPLTIGASAPTLDRAHIVLHGGLLAPLRPVEIVTGHLRLHGGTIALGRPPLAAAPGGLLRYPIQ